MNLIEKIGDQGIAIYMIFFIFNTMNFKNKFSQIMTISILLNIIINAITKHQLIKYMKPLNHRLPILGTFCRPIDTKCENLTISGYGMPSGHSQIATLIPAMYYFLYNDYESFSYTKFYVMASIGLFIMITRYTSKMHSIPQIILGSLYGLLIAFLFSKTIKMLNF